MALTSIPPPRRPGYPERFLRLLPSALRAAASVLPHALHIAVKPLGERMADVEVRWPRWKGPMPGKRRRLARACEYREAHGRWNRALREAIAALPPSDSRCTVLLTGATPSASPVTENMRLLNARTAVVELLDQGSLDDISQFAHDEATLLETERLLRPAGLFSLAWSRGPRTCDFWIVGRAALSDMRGKPIAPALLPQIVMLASQAKQDAFSANVIGNARAHFEKELDSLADGVSQYP